MVDDDNHIARARDATRKLATRERKTDFRAPLRHRSPVNEKPELGGVEFGEPSAVREKHVPVSPMGALKVF